MLSLDNLVFWCFAGPALIAALYMILARNPVRAVLSLIVAFIATAATWLVLQAEFLAITLVLVYVGAVIVLFLFVVMMLDINFVPRIGRFAHWLLAGLALALILFMVIINILMQIPSPTNNAISGLAYTGDVGNTALLGKYIFTRYLLQFEVAGVLLLVAIIAAIGLIFRGPHARKTQSVAAQIKADPSKRIRLVEGN